MKKSLLFDVAYQVVAAGGDCYDFGHGACGLYILEVFHLFLVFLLMCVGYVGVMSFDCLPCCCYVHRE